MFPLCSAAQVRIRSLQIFFFFFDGAAPVKCRGAPSLRSKVQVEKILSALRSAHGERRRQAQPRALQTIVIPWFDFSAGSCVCVCLFESDNPAENTKQTKPLVLPGKRVGHSQDLGFDKPEREERAAVPNSVIL